MKKIKKAMAAGEKQAPDPLILNIIVFLVILITADLITILYFGSASVKTATAPAEKPLQEIVPVEYTNPEAGNLKSLKVGGEFEKQMPVFAEKLKYKLSYDPILAGPNNIHVLSVCCPAGYSKEFYTAKMPWAMILYDFEPGVPTVTLFDVDGKNNTGKFEIVILDKLADETAIKAVAVTIFEELLKQYLPGYVWSGSVRKEIM